MSVSMPGAPPADSPRQSSPATVAEAPPAPVGWPVLLSAAVIVAAVAAAYCNSFSGAMVFDDRAWILENSSIQQLSSIGDILLPRNAAAVGGRPVVSLTLALNHALGGTDPVGYHIVNLCIHALAALVLFGIVRRTLLLPKLRERFGSAATPLALAVALVWAVHPLQTAAVTYIIQRTESLMGLFYLLTLYCVIRGATAMESRSVRRSLWYAGAVAACLLGMVTKEVMFTAPLLVLLYDWMFLSGSVRKALARRRGLYASMAATWSFGLLMLWMTDFHGGTTGPGVDTFSPQSYLLTQPGVILHYLQTAFWPAGLSLDYNWRPAESIAQVAVPGTIIIALLGLTVVGLIKRSALGFLGAAFFLILVPTSSIIPIKDAAFDHRMFLPLAALVSLVVIGAYALWDRLAPRAEEPGLADWLIRVGLPAGLVAIATVALGWGTFVRNKDYRSEEAIWRDVLAKYPDNWRAYASLGYAALSAQDKSNAIALFAKAEQLNPKDSQVQLNLGNLAADRGKIDEAIDHYEQSLKLTPQSAKAQYNLGLALAKKGKIDDAIAHYQEALKLDPENPETHNNLADLFLKRDKFDDAIKQAEAALAFKPDYALAHNNLASGLAAKGKLDEAITHYRRAIELDPKFVDVEYNLGAALARRGNFDEAIGYLEKDLRRRPRDVSARFGLAQLYDKNHQTDKAIADYRTVLEIDPNLEPARINLASALALRGRLDEALEQYDKLLETNSNDAPMQLRAAKLLVQQGSIRQAIVRYRTALNLDPRNAAAHFDLAGCFLALDKTDDAVEQYRAAIEIEPKYSAAHNGLAVLLARQEKLKEALEHFLKAVEFDSENADAHYNAGMIYYRQGLAAETETQWRAAVRLKPNQVAYLGQLALLLAISPDAAARNGKEAVQLARHAVELTDSRDPEMLAILAAAYAEAGEFPKAVESGEQAKELARLQDKSALVDQLTDRLKLYRAGQPYHETAQ
ncbi:MAG TPA: tetratricopeptide repeat protein [Pirellulales bacterium]|jgi:tetratricopeptide (TPR) repeat protein|nr:tetratricopeptide repeat protein [Pirellulales bacterium]